MEQIPEIDLGDPQGSCKCISAETQPIWTERYRERTKMKEDCWAPLLHPPNSTGEKQVDKTTQGSSTYSFSRKKKNDFEGRGRVQIGRPRGMR